MSKDGSVRILRAVCRILRRTLPRSARPFRKMRNDARKMRALPGVFAFHPLQRFLARFEGAFELAGFYCFQDFPKSWARFHSQRDQIVPRNQRWRNDWLVRELFLFALKKFVIVEHGMAAGAINAMEFQFIFKSRARHKSF